jgi:hypothetical protein
MGSQFLAAESSFLDGLSRLIDFTGSLNVYNSSPSDKVADYLAQRLDWSLVGRDLMSACERTRKD